MNRFMNAGLLVATIATLAGCAASGPATTGTTATTATVPATAAAASNAAAPDAVTEKTVDTSGYRKINRNGTDFFCKKEGTTGSRVQAKEVCHTREQLAAAQAANDEFMRRVQNMNNDTRTSDDRQYNTPMTR